MAGAERAGRATLPDRVPVLLAGAVPALVLVFAGWQRRWTTDDAFINYRIVDQLLAGHGPVYNAGERVEAATSTLWVALLALGDIVLPLPLEYVAIAFSLPLVAIGVMAMTVASRRLLGPAAAPGSVWLPAGALVLAALPPVWDFATSGLETGLALAWAGLLALGLSRAVDDPESTPAWALVVAGAAPLVRPDAAITGAAVLAFVVAGTGRAGGWRPACRQVLVAGALPVTYQLFRMIYFASLVPNTALAKQAGVPHWREGWAYLVDLVAPYALWLPVVPLLLALALVARRLPARAGVAVALLPVASVLHVAYLVRAGGDYAHARLLLPPLFTLLAPVAVLPVRRRFVPVVAAVALAGWTVVCAGFLRVGEARIVERSLIADGRGSIVRSIDVAHPVTAEDQGWGRGGPRADGLQAGAVVVGRTPIAGPAPPELDTPATAQSGIGVTGYSLDLDTYLIDRLGLADPLTSRFRLDEPGFIGHEKPIPLAWLSARVSTEPVDPSILRDDGLTTPLYESDPDSFEADVDAARTVLACDRLRSLRAATTARLTPGRAVSNLWRSVTLTRLRVPPAPAEARDDLC